MVFEKKKKKQFQAIVCFNSSLPDQGRNGNSNIHNRISWHKGLKPSPSHQNRSVYLSIPINQLDINSSNESEHSMDSLNRSYLHEPHTTDPFVNPPPLLPNREGTTSSGHQCSVTHTTNKAPQHVTNTNYLNNFRCRFPHSPARLPLTTLVAYRRAYYIVVYQSPFCLSSIHLIWGSIGKSLPIKQKFC